MGQYSIFILPADFDCISFLAFLHFVCYDILQFLQHLSSDLEENKA